jgi:uncharacterized membrane protein
MSKFVVVVLPDEKKAYEALHSIKALHNEGTVTFYGAAVVERKPDGKLDVKQAADEGPLGFATGSLVGGLIGLLGGPVGAATGFAAGAAIGGLHDYVHSGVSDDFIEKVTSELDPGKFAVIAEVSEDWVTPIDMKMEALGGKVVREYRDEFVDDMIQKRADAARSEFERRRAERAIEKAEKTEKLQKRIDEARQDLQRTAAQVRERLEEKKAETDAKIEALERQADKANAELKTRIEQRMAEIRTDLVAREQKLNQAFKLVEQALHP